MPKLSRVTLALLTGAVVSTGAIALEVPTPSFPAADTDPAVGACNDFNKFANAKWIAANPIPADQTRWGGFLMLREQSLEAQHKIVDAAVAGLARAKAGSVEQKIGQLYAAGMDEAKIDKLGFDPIKAELAAIAKLSTRDDVTSFLQQAHARGDSFVFSVSSGADYKNAARQIPFASQGGLALPTPEYYTSEQFAKTREQYVAYLTKIFTLTGVNADKAAVKASHVLAFETRLAQASTPRVEMRKPENQYRLTTVAEADQLTNLFDWSAYFKALKIDASGGFSMGQPNFFAEVNAMLAAVPVAEWQDYLAAHTITGASPYLSKAFADANFEFFGKQMNGQPEQQARWKRVLGQLNASMGQALGLLYVKDYFPPASKARMQELVTNVTGAVKGRIENLEWMSAETKAKAIDKWKAFLPKIGYPDTWRDWSGLKIEAGNYYASARAAQAFNRAYGLSKLGKPTDRYDWGMTPQTVNAYYSSTTNTINFPAAILQPPFFYADGDDPINYGAIGAVIGHEIFHGFDDSGSQFDGQGNNANWWTKEDRERFNARANMLVAQFNEYVPVASRPEVKVNGRLTLGENIGDLGGLHVAYDAMVKATAGKPDPMIDGFTREQRFFLSFARVWRSQARDEYLVNLVKSDPHAPEQFRAIAAPSNMPEFAKAFSCKAGDAMVRADDKRVVIW
ncbi:MAG: M13 family metallopeptidase [Paucibacter sp.]|nr:M13 family metallopeptidase [Roseateles sp.]